MPKNAWTWQKNWLIMKAYTTENHLQIHKKQWINLNDWSACSSRVSSGCYLKITPWIHHSKSFPVQREEYTEYLLSFGADKVQSKPERTLQPQEYKNTILFCFSPCAHHHKTSLGKTACRIYSSENLTYMILSFFTITFLSLFYGAFKNY